MNKKDLVKQIAAELLIPYPEARNILDTFIWLMKKNLREWKDFILPTIWKLVVQETKSRNAYNFQAKEVVEIKAYKSIRLRSSRAFNKTL